jgi:hypothetical protein
VTDPERAAGDGMDGRAVGGAVVGENALGGDAVAGIERDRAPQERDGGVAFSSVRISA